MTSNQLRSPLLKPVATILFYLILASSLLSILIAVFFPYTLTRQSLWLGPSTLAYVPNPYLKVIGIVGSLLSLAWFLIAKDKVWWKIVLVVLALLVCLGSSYVLKTPPAYLG